MSSSNARRLAWLAIGSQFLFVAAWVAAGALEPGYSHVEQGISELGAGSASHPLFVNAALVMLGLAIAAIGVALPAALPGRLAPALFVCAGAAMVASGLLPLDCALSHESCERMWRAGELSWHTDAHLWAGLAAQGFAVLTPFALARALWPGPVAPLAVGAGAVGIALGIATHLLFESTDADGLVQRVSIGVLQVWVIVVAAGVLHAVRTADPPGPLVRLSPRDFFAGEWTGEGELVVAPFAFWRRFPQRMQARRTATWISERVWRIDDEARYAEGRVQRRRMYCEFVSDERVEITGGDMPDGAAVLIEAEGFHVVPFRMEFPVGPVNVPIRVHDESHVEEDGTLVNAFVARDPVFGLKLARVSFRVRPLAHETDQT